MYVARLDAGVLGGSRDHLRRGSRHSHTVFYAEGVTITTMPTEGDDVDAAEEDYVGAPTVKFIKPPQTASGRVPVSAPSLCGPLNGAWVDPIHLRTAASGR